MAISHATAYAKINLALHVRSRRADGYHELETVFAFLDKGDSLSMEKAEHFSLDLEGPFGRNLAGEDYETNLIYRAAKLHGDGVVPPVAFRLDKKLPIAAGLGGGSADAAAALRLLNDASDAPLGVEELHVIAAQLGADVPACIDSLPVVGRGTGTILEPVENDVSGMHCLLVNPNIAVATGPVFKAWDGVDRGPMPEGSARCILQDGRNDLEPMALKICPEIGNILQELRKANPLVARMSGSGATCFALFHDAGALQHAASEISKKNPEWWTMAGCLR